MKRTFPCATTNTDGSPCGRRVRAFGQVCHLHAALAAGQVAPPLPVTDPKALLEGLMQSKDERIQLAAIKAYSQLLIECPTCKQRKDISDRQEDAMRRLTSEQRERVIELSMAMESILEEALTQLIYVEPKPEPRPASDPEPAPQFVRPEPEEVITTVEPVTLDKSEWAACGIREVKIRREDGVVDVIPTHASGDEHAAAIIALHYPTEQAKAEHAYAMKHQ
jgi:hypothetical protein